MAEKRQLRRKLRFFGHNKLQDSKAIVSAIPPNMDIVPLNFTGNRLRRFWPMALYDKFEPTERSGRLKRTYANADKNEKERSDT